jgi:hypothetical protein
MAMEARKECLEKCEERDVSVESGSLKKEGVRFVDHRVLGKRSMLTPRVVTVQHLGGCVRLSGARRRCRAQRSFMHGPFGVGTDFVVGMKRKQCEPEVKQCGRELTESESESEQWKRWRGGEEEQNKKPLQVRYGGAKVACDIQDEGVAEYDHEELKEVQQFLELQLQAAEKREAGMKQHMETMMDVLSQHMGHMERRVGTLERGAQPHQQVLERINVKLEQLMEGFSALNENLAILSACLSKDLESP